MRLVNLRYETLLNLYNTGIVANFIAEELVSCRSNQKIEKCNNKMVKRKFDILGVRQEGIIIGYITKSNNTKGLAADFVNIIENSEVLASNCSILDVLKKLKQLNRIFIQNNNEINGIITRADLQKPSVRIVLFGLITVFEFYMTQLIRNFYPDDSWRKKLKKRRLKKAKRTCKLRKRRNEEIDLIECLELSDKSVLLIKNNKKAINELGFQSNNNAKKQPLLL